MESLQEMVSNQLRSAPNHRGKASDAHCIVDAEIRAAIVALYQGAPCGISAEELADDAVNPAKAIRQAAILGEFAEMNGTRILEVGSGFGANLVVWAKAFGAQVYGVEPDGDGFATTGRISRKLFGLNGLPLSNMVRSVGEHLPFADKTFDIVYSTNALEHTQEPLRVLDEALRVLAPGGVLQFVYPNFRSFFDGHYGIFHPPVVSNGFFEWYVRTVCRRDTSIAKSLRTELNVAWTQQTIRLLAQRFPIEVLSLGQDVFRRRMLTLDFEAWASLRRLRGPLRMARQAGLNRAIAWLMIATQTWTPVILTVRKTDK